MAEWTDLGITRRNILALAAAANIPATDSDTVLLQAVDARVAAGQPGPPGPPGPPGQGGGVSFGGRLTLVQGDAFIASDQIAKQKIFYAPCGGDSVPQVIGGAVVSKPFLAGPTDEVGLELDLAGDADWPAGTLQDVFSVWDGEAVRLATRQWDAGMFPTEVQITGGTTITTGTGPTAWQRPDAAFDGTDSQPWSEGARVFPSNNGTANFIGRDWGPGNAHAISRVDIIAANNNLLLGNATSANLVKVWGSHDAVAWNMLGFFYADCSVNGNTNSFPINVSNRTPYRYHRVCIDGQSTYSINVAELKFYKEVAPVNGRRLARFGGLRVNDAGMAARISATETLSVQPYECMFLGTMRIDAGANGCVTAHTEYGPARTYGLWNAYNRRNIVLKAGIITPNVSSYVVTQQRWGAAQGTDFSLDVLIGLPEEHAQASFLRSGYLQCQSARKAYECGIGVDTVVSFSGKWGGVVLDTGGQNMSFDLEARLTLPKFAGVRKLHGIERTDSGGGIASAFVDQRSTVLEASWWG